MVLLQQLFVDTGSIVKRIVHEAQTHYLAQVAVALHVLGQQDKVPAGTVYHITPSLAANGLVVKLTVTAATGTIGLAAHDGLNHHFAGFLVHFFAVIEKLLNAVHVSVIG